jgi:SAM-dependent methyltransferase
MATAQLGREVALRRLVGGWRSVSELWFDARYGVNTRGIVRDLPGAEQGGAFDHAVCYQSVWTSTFHRAIIAPVIGDRTRYVFVDLGCGKGKAVLLAAMYGFRRVVGLELSPALADIALDNVERFTRRRQDVARPEIIRADAAAYRFPEEPLVVYLHNPFDEIILASVVENLHDSLRQRPRPAFVIYHTPLHRHVLDEAPFLEQRATVPGGVVYGSTL